MTISALHHTQRFNGHEDTTTFTYDIYRFQSWCHKSRRFASRLWGIPYFESAATHFLWVLIGGRCFRFVWDLGHFAESWYQTIPEHFHPVMTCYDLATTDPMISLLATVFLRPSHFFWAIGIDCFNRPNDFHACSRKWVVVEDAMILSRRIFIQGSICDRMKFRKLHT